MLYVISRKPYQYEVMYETGGHKLQLYVTDSYDNAIVLKELYERDRNLLVMDVQRVCLQIRNAVA